METTFRIDQGWVIIARWLFESDPFVSCGWICRLSTWICRHTKNVKLPGQRANTRRLLRYRKPP